MAKRFEALNFAMQPCKLSRNVSLSAPSKNPSADNSALYRAYLLCSLSAFSLARASSSSAEYLFPRLFECPPSSRAAQDDPREIHTRTGWTPKGRRGGRGNRFSGSLFVVRSTVRETREWDAHLWPRCAENDDDDEPGSDLCKQACVRRTRWLPCGRAIPTHYAFRTHAYANVHRSSLCLNAGPCYKSLLHVTLRSNISDEPRAFLYIIPTFCYIYR